MEPALTRRSLNARGCVDESVDFFVCLDEFVPPFELQAI